MDEDTLVEIAYYAFSEQGPPDPVLDFEWPCRKNAFLTEGSLYRERRYDSQLALPHV